MNDEDRICLETACILIDIICHRVQVQSLRDEASALTASGKQAKDWLVGECCFDAGVAYSTTCQQSSQFDVGARFPFIAMETGQVVIRTLEAWRCCLLLTEDEDYCSIMRRYQRNGWKRDQRARLLSICHFRICGLSRRARRRLRRQIRPVKIYRKKTHAWLFRPKNPWI